MNKKLAALIAFGVAKKLIIAAALLAPNFGWAEVDVVDSWVRATVGNARAGAAYVTLVNIGEKDDALVGAASPVAEHVMIHTTKDENGIMSMEHIEELPLPIGVEVGMFPGGYHIMLMQLKEPLKAGLEIPLTLELKSGTSQNIRVPIKPVTYQGEHAGHDHSHHHHH